MSINSNFDKLGFHDSGISEIIRNRGNITLKLENVFLSSEHPQSNGVDKLLSKCTLHIFSVESERAVYWDDSKAGKEHPEPNFPLDEIMHAQFENGVFHFDGFKKTEAWFEWFITANKFELEINEKDS